MFRVLVKPSDAEGLNHKQALQVIGRELESTGLAQNAELIAFSACGGPYELRGDWMPESQFPADVLHQLAYVRSLCPRGYAVSLVLPTDG